MSCLSVSSPKNIKMKIHRTTILPVVSHAGGVWEQGAEIIGPKRDEVAGECRSGGDS
jgi:hypothetical protein